MIAEQNPFHPNNDLTGAAYTTLEASQKVRQEKDWAEPVNATEGQDQNHKPTAFKGQADLLVLLSNLPGIAYRCRPDRNWTMEFASQGCLELTGYQPGEIIQNKLISFANLMHPEDRDLVREQVNKALRDQVPFDLVYRIRTRSGEEKWVRDLGRGVHLPENSTLVLEGFIRDNTDHSLAEKRIQKQVQRFEALRKIDLAITASSDLRFTLDILLDQVIQQLGADATDLLLPNPVSQILGFAAGRGFHTQALQHTHLRLGEGYAGKAALERRMIYVSDLTETLGEIRRAPGLAGEGFRTYFAIPLVAKGRVKGVLEIFLRTQYVPDEEWLEFLQALVGQAAIAIDNATLFNDLQRSNLELNLAYDATLEGLSKALELGDRETEGHSLRVMEMTLRLARALGLSEAELHSIRRGALLHDIGKMGIPDSILLKPGPLTEEEWEIMRQHPVYAFQLLSPISNLQRALEIPYSHHEKWDGSGYPLGLKEEQIPLSARIFAIVDVWDALLSKRPYRPAWPEEKAFAYLREQSSKHFDPRVVEAFLMLFSQSSK